MTLIDTSTIRYVTNQAGETTDIVIPLATWQQWLNNWQEAQKLLASQLNGASWWADHEALWQNLALFDEFPWSKEWTKEIETRCQEIDNQTVTLIPVEDGLAQLRQKFLP